MTRKQLRENWNGIERVSGDRRWLEPVLEKTFREYDPYRPVMSGILPVRTVIFQTYGYHLDEDQFNALLAAIETGTDQRFYISEVECAPDPFDGRCDHWLCRRPTFKDYAQLPVGVWNALYSLDGSWGILISDELHVFLACDEPFWREFRKHYPYSERDRAEFVEYWDRYQKEGTQADWLDKFLTLLNK